MEYWFIALLVALAIYEIIEHLFLPLFWTIRYHRRRADFGPSGMIGKRCVVKQWQGTHGKVKIGSEFWNAYSTLPLVPDTEVVILDIKGLTLQVSTPDNIGEGQNNDN